MSLSTGPILSTILLVVGTLCSVMASSDLEASLPQGLHLTAYSEKQVKGCYNYNQTLGICFDVRKSSIKLLKTTGEKIVFYMDLGPNMFYYQVVDQGFIG